MNTSVGFVHWNVGGRLNYSRITAFAAVALKPYLAKSYLGFQK